LTKDKTCDILSIESKTGRMMHMLKYEKATEILLPRGNKAKCPIYLHDHKFYIKANKPNTESYSPFYYEGEEYTEVTLINNYWWKVTQDMR
jgi:hypothetical protein